VKILITSGATREYLDDVRFLTNVSTGGTGAKLADALAARGHAVTLLRGEGAVLPHTLPASAVQVFSSTENLQAHLKRLLGSGEFDAVLQCAAVSDYRPAELHDGKMTSYAPELTLRLVPTPKLLPELKSYAPAARRPLVIGFKLTSGADSEARLLAVSKLFAAGTVDAAIHNDMADLAAGDARPFRAYRSTHQPPVELAGLPALVEWLHALLSTSGLAPAAAKR
jgi:phosphopantothenoylcysteine decarboxylase/phosphopantothenate--cysteine ligase